MTLKVTITHADPNYPAKIRVVEKNPKLVSQESSDGQAGTIIGAGESRDFYVHGAQDLMISEVEAGE